MTTALFRTLALALAVSLVPSIAAAATDAILNGSILHREKDALPANAEVRVQLIDAIPGEEPKVRAETTFPTQGRQVPIPFALPFDPGKLEDGTPHALRAYILIDGRIAYVTRARINIDPKAIPVSVSILLVPGDADPVATDSPAPPGALKAPSSSRSRGAAGQSRQQQQLLRQLQERASKAGAPGQAPPAPPPKN